MDNTTKNNKRKIVMGIIIGLLVLGALYGAFSLFGQADLAKKVVIGVQSATPDKTKEVWLPVAAAMGKKLSIEADVFSASQTETVNALRDGKVDVVWLSSNVAIDAVTNADAEAFALYYNVNGTNGYKGVVVTRKDTGIKTIDEVMTQGKYNYASGEKTSTSGYVLPQHFLFNKLKSSPEKMFKSVIYGGHIPNLEALMAKKVDIAVNNSTDLATFQAKNPEAKDNIIVLWESPLVPNDVLMCRKDMSKANKERLSNFFLNYGKSSEEEKAVLKKASNIDHFIPTTIKVLEPVSEFKFATERSGIEQNSKLTPEEKTSQLKNLDARIDKFKKALAETK